MRTIKLISLFSLLIFLVSNLNAQNQSRTLGNKSYEVSNHLGNVMTVVSDRKTPTPETTNTTVAFNETDIKAFSDYYPYGMILDERNDSNEYRFSFQGQENDNEVKGANNSINYKYRVHDPRLGRFFAVDPLSSKYPHYSSYQFSGNKTIAFVELEGLEENDTVQFNIIHYQDKTYNILGDYNLIINTVTYKNQIIINKKVEDLQKIKIEDIDKYNIKISKLKNKIDKIPDKKNQLLNLKIEMGRLRTQNLYKDYKKYFDDFDKLKEVLRDEINREADNIGPAIFDDRPEAYKDNLLKMALKSIHYYIEVEKNIEDLSSEIEKLQDDEKVLKQLEYNHQ